MRRKINKYREKNVYTQTEKKAEKQTIYPQNICVNSPDVTHKHVKIS